ncbi:MAG: vitamin B12-dependent ribonucleotide reductase [Caldithrix sp.]|nr:MAG: vitamin B12-dependent ribonucleotide reductase [Caldithrix sp.]
MASGFSAPKKGRASATGPVSGSGADGKGLTIANYYTAPDKNPFDSIKWEKRTAKITNEKGEVIFEQKNIETPSFWSQTALNVVASKYFNGKLGTPQREGSVKQLINRVSETLSDWGREDDYFATEGDAATFYHELTHILINQKATFNSPVWFNCGIEEKPQCSACFINSVTDSMSSILDLAKTEGMLFKWGSGAGSNLSAIRSSKEKISGGGTASGPVSFMKGFDAFAGVIKSGGKTRRAAKMVILNIDHPDIVEFINCKTKEEKKAWALIDAGYDSAIDGEAYTSIFFQNANHSVRVSDEFMKAFVEDKKWQTREITSGNVADSYRAKDLMKMIAEAAWLSGDPGIQFDTMINDWHTCLNTDRIYASNPCSEYMFLDDTACNLSSINLMKFRKEDGEFDVESFLHTVSIMTLAKEIIVGNASYPTPAIAKNSHDFRPLGLGYANLGALLMSLGLPYDSDQGRGYAAAITALMGGQAYKTSAIIASKLGPFPKYKKNRTSMLRVIKQHRQHVDKIRKELVPSELFLSAKKVWDDAYALGSEYGYKNSQVTVLAPTGTIAFMMDCDTTGIEPDLALVKYKKLVGGGVMKIVNNTIPEALKKLNYTDTETSAIVKYVDENDTIEGAPGLKQDHLPVFDCSFKPANGERTIHHMGHVKMMAAAQPFLSGAISKTVNMPNDVTPEDIAQTYIESWKMGLKSIAIYRDGCKRSQPLNTDLKDGDSKKSEARAPVVVEPRRKRLPDERQAITHKFSIAGHEGYITVGMYEDGTPGEIFIVMAKEGSVVSGLMDSFATAISLALQYGVPLTVLINKFIHSRFEPSGFTNNPKIRIAKSITDYIFRWLALKFLPADESQEAMTETDEFAPESSITQGQSDNRAQEKLVYQTQADAPPCYECGSIMVRNGSCYKCLNCGSTSGCS